jgi:hypothetical protein
MAPLVTFTKFDVVRLLALARARDVDRLVDDRILTVSAYTPEGRPLFDAESVRRAAASLTLRGLPTAEPAS